MALLAFKDGRGRAQGAESNESVQGSFHRRGFQIADAGAWPQGIGIEPQAREIPLDRGLGFCTRPRFEPHDRRACRFIGIGQVLGAKRKTRGIERG